jgi:thiol-disulfide isomerase/thioredoxin
MSNLSKRVELIANVAIIVVAILLSVMIVKRFVLDKGAEQGRPDASSAKELSPGDKVPLSDIDWAKNNRTILLVVQKGCHFCTESAPFYQRLVKELSGRSDVRLIALLPQPVADGRQYLNELGVNVEDVRQVAPSQLNIQGTPTLVLVNNSGVVTDVWLGKLRSDTETQVIDKLKS